MAQAHIGLRLACRTFLALIADIALQGIHQPDITTRVLSELQLHSASLPKT
jgi:hypothetical protein